VSAGGRIFLWSDRGASSFHSVSDSPDDDLPPGKHIVWGDEAKPPVFGHWPTALLYGLRTAYIRPRLGQFSQRHQERGCLCRVWKLAGTRPFTGLPENCRRLHATRLRHGQSNIEPRPQRLPAMWQCRGPAHRYNGGMSTTCARPPCA
jgi:hypothetical protein